MVSQSLQSSFHPYLSTFHSRTVHKNATCVSPLFLAQVLAEFLWLGISAGANTQRSKLIMW